MLLGPTTRCPLKSVWKFGALCFSWKRWIRASRPFPHYKPLRLRQHSHVFFTEESGQAFYNYKTSNTNWSGCAVVEKLYSHSGETFWALTPAEEERNVCTPIDGQLCRWSSCVNITKQMIPTHSPLHFQSGKCINNGVSVERFEWRASS